MAKMTAAEFKVKNPEVDWETLQASTNSFVKDVLGKLNQYGSISEKQIAAIEKSAAKQAEWVAKDALTVKAEVPTERLLVTGEVITIKWQEGFYGSQQKMLVEVTTDVGVYKVWGTVPSTLQGQYGCTGCKSTGIVHNDGCDQCYVMDYIGAVKLGDQVCFVATLKQSDKDTAFGFFSRPAKAHVVELLAI